MLPAVIPKAKMLIPPFKPMRSQKPYRIKARAKVVNMVFFMPERYFLRITIQIIPSTKPIVMAKRMEIHILLRMPLTLSSPVCMPASKAKATTRQRISLMADSR